MKSRTLVGIALVASVTAGTQLRALPQTPAIVGAQFDVVSIKPNAGGQEYGWNTLPDGTLRAIHVPVSVLITAAAPIPVIEVKGLPDWARTENYDIIAKPAPDAKPTPAQRLEMIRNLFLDRMKLVAHVEDAERDGFALTLARKDRKLGPQLTKTKLDCAGADEKRCGSVRFSATSLEAHGMRMDQFAGSLRRTVGVVINRTGLDAQYDVTLSYAPPRLDPTAAPDDAPSIFTAVQEQLGLRLVPEKTMVKIFVVDHIERPTPN